MRHALLALILAGLLPVALSAGDPAPAAPAPATAKPYPLDTCIVSGESLGGMGDPVVLVQDGQEVKFCCKGCVRDFKKDPAKYLKKLEAEKPAAADAKPIAPKP